jgi:hypothetical protein
MPKAWVGMVLLADNDWFYASPTLTENFGDTETALKEQEEVVARAGKYQSALLMANTHVFPWTFTFVALIAPLTVEALERAVVWYPHNF